MSFNVLRSLIEARPRNAVSSPTQTSIGTTAGQAVAANDARKGLIIQNTGTTTLKFCLGSATPTQTAYHFALAPCDAADDGKSPPYIDAEWTGAVQVISSGAGGTFVLTEITGSP